MHTHTSTYAAALNRFLDWSGLNAAELAELAGLEPRVVLDAAAGLELPSAAQRSAIAGQITDIRRERA